METETEESDLVWLGRQAVWDTGTPGKVGKEPPNGFRGAGGIGEGGWSWR